MERVRRLITVTAPVVLALSSWMVATTTSATASPSTFKACEVTDTGGIHDHAFNASAWAGLKNAAKQDRSITTRYLSSSTSSDYAPSINRFIAQGCGLIVTVGFLMDEATTLAANAHPHQKFAIVDDSPVVRKGAQVLALRYQTDQAAFLGGVLAAGMTKTKTVATFGSQNLPGVTLSMNGFVAGVRYYDKTYSKKVRVLGWKPIRGACSVSTCKGRGTFIGNTTDQTAGKTVTSRFFAEHADIVFPVAGSIGIGAVAAAQAAGAGHSVLWVDSNGCTTVPTYCQWFVGTVAKGVERSVEGAVLAAAHGAFRAGTYRGTLKNGGVALEYGGVKVPKALRAKIATARAGVIAGATSLEPNAYPAAK